MSYPTNNFAGQELRNFDFINNFSELYEKNNCVCDMINSNKNGNFSFYIGDGFGNPGATGQAFRFCITDNPDDAKCEVMVLKKMFKGSQKGKYETKRNFLDTKIIKIVDDKQSYVRGHLKYKDIFNCEPNIWNFINSSRVRSNDQILSKGVISAGTHGFANQSVIHT